MSKRCIALRPTSPSLTAEDVDATALPHQGMHGQSTANGHPNEHHPLDASRYLSAFGASREPSALRALVPIMAIPGMISLGGGLPNPALFPFESVRVRMKDGFEWSFGAGDAHDMTEAFQYSGTPGIDSLLTQLRDLQQREHSPPLPSTAWSVAVTVGSQDGLAKMFELLVSADDTVLTETPTYSGALSILRPMGCKIRGIECDQFGVVPESLELILSGWDTAIAGRRPHVLYIIPTGQNPSGTSMTLERKRRVYELCCQFDLIILEDDPYAFLTFGAEHAPVIGRESEFVRPSVPSLWSMDLHGRVIRFDSLSKVLSSGLRLGFVTGPKSFVDRMLLITQATNLHPSGISQLMAAKFLAHLGASGWQRHVDSVSLFYARRRDILCDAIVKHLQGLVEFVPPTAGMFVWLKLLHVHDSKKLIEEQARRALVLLVPGQVFMPNSEQTSYVRASFSLASAEDMDTAMQRLAQILRAEQQS